MAYIGAEAVVFDLKANYMKITFVLNVNGNRLMFSAESACLPSEGGVITATISSLNLGTKVLGEEYVISFLKYLKVNTKDEEWLDANPDERTISIDLAAITNTQQYEALISQSTGAQISISDGSGEIGEIDLTYSF